MDSPIRNAQHGAPLVVAIGLVGLTNLARHLGVTHQAVRKWEAAGRMPRTEWTGETGYARVIERVTDGVVTREQLLDKWPAEQRDAA